MSEYPGADPDAWEVGIKKMRQSIMADTNPAMTRFHLTQEMTQGDWYITKWAVELKIQAKRITWNDYDWKSAALDALIFQIESKTWKDNVLKEHMTLHKMWHGEKGT